MNFQEIFEKYQWKAIKNCPGRYTLVGGTVSASPTEFLHAEVKVRKLEQSKASDEVLVVHFDDGCGLLSYRKDDGTYLHTLNSESGLKRKIADLQS